MSGICDTCQRLKRIGCGQAMDNLKTCDMYENESRYDKLFGTPEKAARTLLYVLNCMDSRSWVSCDSCPIFDGCAVRDEGRDELLKWLRSDA